ncbi:MAG: Lrp/AsnC family transcriptional regulator [Proteobacteria bacterium]|nr:Lrp/AsnC family transcriptional regulator [Pseudomonadota bacterium]NOG61756.1 Lrp/AsnC family transcriptional regulator [Pseudomonadota bacterium]
MPDNNKPVLDETDRRIVEATQAGLPVTARPYHVIAEQLELDPELVMQRIRQLLESGIIRRIGVVPNHYKLGYRANGMTVWDVPDDKIIELGNKIGSLNFVSHCYHRPRHLPDWPYNLFAMVHAHTKEKTNQYIDVIKDILGDSNRQHTVLYSTRILKKTGMRIGNTQ